MSARTFLNIALAALLGVLLLGCQAPGGVESATAPGATDPEAAFYRGDYARAARGWEAQAQAADPAVAGSLWISAANAWALAERPEAAREALRRLDRTTLLASDRSRMNLVLADLALQGGRPDEADILLREAEATLPSASRSRYEGLYARLFEQLTGPSSRELGQAVQIGESMRYYDPNATVEIMRLLENVTLGELAIRAANPRADRRTAGWLDLARVIRESLPRPERAEARIAEWKTRYPGHILTEAQGLDTFLRYRQDFMSPLRVAVLLPGSGRLQAAGEALRDGLMNAYLQNPMRSELQFFPTDDDPESAIAAYFSALDAGANLIVGPLRRESVEAMLRLPGMATPVLALNDLPDPWTDLPGLEGRVRGISLSQDAEAAATASRAVRSGYERAMVLAPETAWGERMAGAFQDEFLRDDQQIVAALRYPERENDHSALLERALKIDESEARKRQIENTLQTRVGFEPVRRDDIDMIFLAADATQARLIRPQLRFHDAGDIPVYATGRVYDGQPDATRNQDLNGIRFPTTRWQLEHTEKDTIPDLASLRGGALAPLFALGRDAWNILPWLGLMNRDPGFLFPGESGDYRAGLDGALKRDPAWAEFRRGRPAPLPPIATPDRSGLRGPVAGDEPVSPNGD
ncbi:MAG: penicillin-binding protein activator [Xanthomonadales bacterium]